MKYAHNMNKRKANKAKHENLENDVARNAYIKIYLEQKKVIGCWICIQMDGFRYRSIM